MPYTFTGRSVKPGHLTHPSLIDIAVGLSRQPRFAGQGRRWFSVLDHSLFCDELVKREEAVPVIGNDDVDAKRLWRIAVLLHDAHEAITGDIPTTFKSAEMRLAQVELDQIIAHAFYPGGWSWYGSQTVHDAIKRIDRRALVAEARIVGPEVEYERILHAFGSTDTQDEDIDLLVGLLDQARLGITPTTWGPDWHAGVLDYLRRYLELR